QQSRAGLLPGDDPAQARQAAREVRHDAARGARRAMNAGGHAEHGSTRVMPGSGQPLARFAWISAGAAVATIGLKTAAWLVTGSIGLLSDALESFVNLATALLA